jgi:hypothetical protein
MEEDVKDKQLTLWDMEDESEVVKEQPKLCRIDDPECTACQ